MCTVTFSPRRSGYALAMNRDETFTRIAGLPPRSWKMNGRTVLCPAEPGGGTWISVNDTGTTLALINWYAVGEQVKGRGVSRGEVVNTTGIAHTPGLVAEALARLPLPEINPFRLIGIFPATNEIIEWRWDLKKLASKRHHWSLQQWISSGFDEPAAQRVRGRVFQHARRQKSAANLDWLRRLHRSHLPESGPFSTCMHRQDAATVSYTEIVVSPHKAVMRYHAGAPCRCSDHSVHRLSRLNF
jgi:hypothetical protein